MPDERRKTQDKTPGLSHNVSRRTYLYTTPSGLVQGPASDLLTNRVPQAEEHLNLSNQRRDTALMVANPTEAMLAEIPTSLPRGSWAQRCSPTDR
jgi:hypothetical protein